LNAAKPAAATAYFAFVVALLLALFLYLGWALSSGTGSGPVRNRSGAPAMSIKSIPQGGLALVPESSGRDPAPPAEDPVARSDSSRLTDAERTTDRSVDDQAEAEAESEGEDTRLPAGRPTPLGTNREDEASVTVQRQAQPQERIYIVRPQDTLSAIARRTLGSSGRWREILKLNEDTIRNPDRLRPGMRLKLPVQERTDPSSRTHRVRDASETLRSISVMYFGTPRHADAIREANGDVLGDDGRITPGMVLALPDRDELAPAEPREYTVRPGDTLSGIAQEFYGDPGKWRRIAAANASINSPSDLKPGEVVLIPPVQ
jgi:nucleoid-associated protein YgaU